MERAIAVYVSIKVYRINMNYWFLAYRQCCQLE